MHRFATVIAAGGCVALLAAGCGSSGDKGLSKAEFLKQGNAICAKGNAEINAAGKKIFGPARRPSRAAGLKFATDTLVPKVGQQINDIAALKPPKADKNTVDALIAGVRQAFAKVKAHPALALASGAHDPFADANKKANAYGLTKCGGSS